MFPAAAIPGTDGLLPYGSCLRLDVAGGDPRRDLQDRLRRRRDAPGLRDDAHDDLRAAHRRLRDRHDAGRAHACCSRIVPARASRRSRADHTILVGYAQGHVGYMLAPEDWLLGGYEPSVTFWGPLEAEYVAEQLAALMPLAMTPMREDGTERRARRASRPRRSTDNLDDRRSRADGGHRAGDRAGGRLGAHRARRRRRSRRRRSRASRASRRSRGSATIRSCKTPHVTLQRETRPGTYADVTRRSGRVVEDQRDRARVHAGAAAALAARRRTAGSPSGRRCRGSARPGADSLDDRGGVPLGNYRFHVEGNGWTLDSPAVRRSSRAASCATATRGSGTIKVDRRRGTRRRAGG